MQNYTHTTLMTSLTNFCRLGYGDLYAVQVVSHKTMKSTVTHGLAILFRGTWSNSVYLWFKFSLYIPTKAPIMPLSLGWSCDHLHRSEPKQSTGHTTPCIFLELGSQIQHSSMCSKTFRRRGQITIAMGILIFKQPISHTVKANLNGPSLLERRLSAHR